MVNPKIVDAKDVKRYPRKAPAVRLLEAMPPGWMSAREVADHFGVGIETIRRLGRAKTSDGAPRFKAPSKALTSGELVVWAYTPADVEELADYFGDRNGTKRGKKGK